MDKRNAIAIKRQALYESMLENCNNDPAFLNRMILDYIKHLSDTTVDMICDGWYTGG